MCAGLNVAEVGPSVRFSELKGTQYYCTVPGKKAGGEREKWKQDWVLLVGLVTRMMAIILTGVVFRDLNGQVAGRQRTELDPIAQ